MVVYRVEMPDGFGPYWSDCTEDFRYKMGRKHNGSALHPGGADDFPDMRRNQDFFFGFSSMKQLFAWFGGFIRPILNSGGQIRKYIVDDSHVVNGKSGRQLVFNRQHAKLVSA